MQSLVMVKDSRRLMVGVWNVGELDKMVWLTDMVGFM
jgi:thymidylate synthase